MKKSIIMFSTLMSFAFSAVAVDVLSFNRVRVGCLPYAVVSAPGNNPDSTYLGKGAQFSYATDGTSSCYFGLDAGGTDASLAKVVCLSFTESANGANTPSTYGYPGNYQWTFNSVYSDGSTKICYLDPQNNAAIMGVVKNLIDPNTKKLKSGIPAASIPTSVTKSTMPSTFPGFFQ